MHLNLYPSPASRAAKRDQRRANLRRHNAMLMALCAIAGSFLGAAAAWGMVDWEAVQDELLSHMWVGGGAMFGVSAGAAFGGLLAILRVLLHRPRARPTHVLVAIAESTSPLDTDDEQQDSPASLPART